MKERPILFSAPMVRALLNCTKSQTRRVVKPQPDWIDEVKHAELLGPFVWPIGSLGQQCGMPVTKLPYGQSGDRLWVREAFHTSPHFDCLYRADYDDRTVLRKVVAHGGWKPSIHMPRAFSRILLEIVSVRVERLQEISAEDAIAEGICIPIAHGLTDINVFRAAYRDLWESINGPGSWDKNPWVWVIEFRRLA